MEPSVDAFEPTVLFPMGPLGVVVRSSFVSSWRRRSLELSQWSVLESPCTVASDALRCLGTITIEEGAAEYAGEGAERLVDRVRTRYDGQGRVLVEEQWRGSTPLAGPSLFDLVGIHDLESLSCVARP